MCSTIKGKKLIVPMLLSEIYKSSYLICLFILIIILFFFRIDFIYGEKHKNWDILFDSGQNEKGRYVLQTDDDGYIIVGDAENYKNKNKQIIVIKLNCDGEVQWTKNIGGNADCDANMIQQLKDKCYLIVGSKGAKLDEGLGDLILIKLNHKGDVIWEKVIDEKFFDTGRSVKQTKDGNYVITGYTHSKLQGYEQVCKAWVLKLDQNGETGSDQANLLKFQ